MKAVNKEVFEVLQIKSDNNDEIFKFLEGRNFTFCRERNGIIICISSHYIFLNIGDWIVKREGKYIRFCKEEDFANIFQTPSFISPFISMNNETYKGLSESLDKKAKYKTEHDKYLASLSIENNQEKPIDWEERRYQMTKDFIGILLSNEARISEFSEGKKVEILDKTVHLVDLLIEQLKK